MITNAGVIIWGMVVLIGCGGLIILIGKEESYWKYVYQIFLFTMILIMVIGHMLK